MGIIINNTPDKIRNFVVARFCDGEWWYWGSWDNVFEASNAATEIGGHLFTREALA